MTILERMHAAAVRLRNAHYRNPASRSPRVFFLTVDDYAEFIAAADYEWAFVPFYKGGRPASIKCPLFEGIAVRETNASKKPVSQLFSLTGTCVSVRVDRRKKS